MDERPPEYPGPPYGEPVEEPFPRFQTQGGFQSPRATGARPYRGGGQANPWLAGLAVAAVLIAVSVVSFGLFSPGDETAATTSTTSTTDPTGTTATTDPTATTDGSGTTATTDGSAEVTLPTTPVSTEITPIGDPIPVNELTMTSSDIGILDFGDDGDQVLGQLAATFGSPTLDTGFRIGDGTFGECPGDTIRVVQWGPLNVVIGGDATTNEFLSYRMDLDYGDLTSDTREIATLSGLRAGDQVSVLKDIYDGFEIEYVVDPNVGEVFKLYPQGGGDLLLWGPVDGHEDEDLVRGIYSPDSCGA